MNKGQTIRHLISEGYSDNEVLARVQTTINSIRWHRSKMKASTAFTPAAPQSPKPSRFQRLTVGEFFKSKGYDVEVLAALKKLGYDEDQSQAYWERLAQWSFVWNSNVGGRFGQAHSRKRQIEVHKCLETLEHDLHETSLHEACHVLDYIITGRMNGHQWEWQRLMIAFGLPTNACGDPSIAAKAALKEVRAAKNANKRAIEKWVCKGCGLEELIYRKRKHPASAYRHRKCGGQFESHAV